MELSRRLAARLEEGPLPFRDWMEACLYGPDGYYMRPRPAPRTGTDAQADFATNPTLHPFLAQCVAREAVALWSELGRPEDFCIAEFGGGTGRLARDALAYLANQNWRPRWLHVEISPGHRAAQEGPGVEHVDRLPRGFVGLVVAHEFLDALPVHLLERTDEGWNELAVARGPRLVPVAPAPGALEAAPAVDVPPGHRVVANAAARTWFHDVGQHMVRGAVLMVDYGDEGVALWGRDPRWGTIRTFRAHQEAGSPLEEPGRKDITASIDFAQCRTWAREAGLEESQLETQEAFLLRHGVLDALNGIDRSSVEGASAYLRLRQMLLPTAMGQAFRVALYRRRGGVDPSRS